MPPYATPAPYDFKLGNDYYLAPPPGVMRQIGEPWYRRRSMPWFPDRTQGAAISESLLPPKSEASFTIRDRSGGFGWTEPSADAEADEVRVYAYTDAVGADAAGDGQGVDCSVEGMVLLGPKVNTVTVTGGDGAFAGSFELTVGGTRYVYAVFGTKLFRSSDGTTWANVQANLADLPAPLTGRPAVFQGAQASALVYLPMGTGQTFRVWDGNPASGFGAPTATDTNKVIDFIVDGAALWGLWLDTTAASQAYRLSKCYDGIAGGGAGTTPSWLPSIVVSDRSDAAQYLLFASDRLYVGCNHSLRELAEDRDKIGRTLWKTQPAASNFKAWTDWRGELWFAAQQGTYRLLTQGNQVVFDPSAGPESLPNNRTPVRGTVTALAGDDYCLYLFIKNESGVTYLLKYRYYDRGRRAAYHSISRIGTYTVNYACVTTVGGVTRLLWDTGNATLQHARLPSTGFYPPGDPAYEYCTSGYLYETRLAGGMHFVTKTLIAFTGRAQNLTATEKLTPYYRSGVGDAFTQYGAEDLQADPGGRIQLSTPVSVAWWEPRLKLERGGTATATPKLTAATYAYALRPLAKGYFTVYVWIADYAQARSQLVDRRKAVDLEATLVALDSSAGTTLFTNRRGLSYDVMIDEVDIFSVEGLDDGKRDIQTVARITASEYLARTPGTHGALGQFTHIQLGQYTHTRLSTLL